MNARTELFRPGRNIAVKVPLHRHAATVAFYRDTIGLPIAKELANSTGFAFGGFTLWIDRVEHQSQTDVWLEVFTDDVPAATTALEAAGAPIRDTLEPLDEVFGHWTSDPAGVVLLVRSEELRDAG